MIAARVRRVGVPVGSAPKDSWVGEVVKLKDEVSQVMRARYQNGKYELMKFESQHGETEVLRRGVYVITDVDLASLGEDAPKDEDGVPMHIIAFQSFLRGLRGVSFPRDQFELVRVAS